MLRNSFIFIPGIGKQTELKLWEHGISTWADLLDDSSRAPTNGIAEEELQVHLTNAIDALGCQQASYFATNLPRSEFWRLYPDFIDKTLYLDIETTGLSKVYNKTTVVTTYDGEEINFFIRGSNLDDLVSHIDNYQLLITFNGKWFDIPFLKEDLADFTDEPPVHLDLRPISQSMGLKGGLKEVEKQLGIKRPEPIRDVGGREATELWSQFIHGDDDALEMLLQYNIFDTVNLEAILLEYIEEQLNDLKIPFKEPRQLKIDPSGDLVDGNGFIDDYLDKISNRFARPALNGSNIGITSVSMDELQIDHGENQLVVVREDAKGDVVDISAVLNEIDYTPVSIGIDLSSSEDKPSGISILRGGAAEVETLFDTADIVQMVRKEAPDIVSIDSPLSLPEGRCCISSDCHCEEHGIIREAERELKSRGVNVYPCLIDSMRGLTQRGIELAVELEKDGHEVIESYPGAAQDILDIPRKGVGNEALENGLNSMGIAVEGTETGKISHHELDAITSALVGHFYLADLHEEVGRKNKGIIVPDQNRLRALEEKCQLAS